MTTAIFFKWLQRHNQFRNPNLILKKPNLEFEIPITEQKNIQNYLQQLSDRGISFTYPSHPDYPKTFYRMKEPPLFLEYKGHPVWNQKTCLSVVGSRQEDALTRLWLESELVELLNQSPICLVSGGAKGVDQIVHRCALRANSPTIVVLPSGLSELYPNDLKLMEKWILSTGGALLSEFEMDQKIHKHHFYFRNRLIANLSSVTLVAQAQLKSGTLLTVHHALESGRVVATIPAHPQQRMFSGNVQLLQDGAIQILNAQDLDTLLKAETWSSPVRDMENSISSSD